ncbi:putative glycosidase crf2 [Golovinomyces cichoracearum]|uniref:Crh-like protein n=1 Tax=Golovinomyces cichoracearum TaxID=62708 RepID=A0A420IWS4_9PEZI|nr:putative glycosidase crf2 [Golovinomyces cichoracearum]
MFRTSVTLVTLAVSLTTVLGLSCSQNKHCPESTPCCSQYGECGVGAFCLGGCDPVSSFSLESCMPAPVCENKIHKFDSKLSTIVPNTKYLGDPSVADWVSSGQPQYYDNGVLLTMAPDTVGTLLASTTYMWYGNVKARFKTSRGAGVVTAFILLSDVKDEIDYEFVGTDLNTAQSNYYSQGITNYHNSENISLSNTFTNYHTYEIDWTPDQITWSIDGNIGRIKKRADTWNSTSNQWAYPQTPARIQLSLWPGGLPTNEKGTIEWAGGLVDWNSPDIQNNNYYYAIFESIEITCYDAKSGPGTRKHKSYTYNDVRATNDTVIDGNKDTILKSFMATGLNPNVGPPSLTSNAPAPSKSMNTIPGLIGGNPGIDSHDDGKHDSKDPNSNNLAPDPSPSSNSPSTNDGSGTTFSQGDSKASHADIATSPGDFWKSIFFVILIFLEAIILL